MAELLDIYKLRSSLENGIKNLFEAEELVAITRQEHPENFHQVRPRFEIKASIGAATGHRHLCPDNIVRFDYFRFVLALQVVTNPAVAGSSNTAHEDFVAKARVLMSTAAQQSWDDETNFPLVFIAEPLRDAGTESVLKDSEGVEYSTLAFNGIACIRQTAWPN